MISNRRAHGTAADNKGFDMGFHHGTPVADAPFCPMQAKRCKSARPLPAENDIGRFRDKRLGAMGLLEAS